MQWIILDIDRILQGRKAESIQLQFSGFLGARGVSLPHME